MFQFLKNNRFRISIGVILFSFFLILIGQVERGRAENFFTKTIQTIALPFQWVSDWAVDGIGGMWTTYVWQVGLADENERLKGQIAELTEHYNRYLELQSSYRRLLSNMEFKETNQDVKVFARVVGEKIDSFSRLVIINKGSSDGIKKNFAVVTPKGVVGKIHSVTPFQSVVQLVTDSRSGFPVLVQRTRAKAMVHGDLDGNLNIRRFPRREEIQIGDQLVTSGLAGIFPKGFPIGIVSKVDRKDYGLFQKITLEPSADLNRLEEVAVVLYSVGNIHQPLFTE